LARLFAVDMPRPGPQARRVLRGLEGMVVVEPAVPAQAVVQVILRDGHPVIRRVDIPIHPVFGYQQHIIADLCQVADVPAQVLFDHPEQGVFTLQVRLLDIGFQEHRFEDRHRPFSVQVLQGRPLAFADGHHRQTGHLHPAAG